MFKENEIQYQRYVSNKKTKYSYMKDTYKTNPKAVETGARKPYAVCNK